MALTELTFTLNGDGYYYSNPVQLQGDSGIHVEFSSNRNYIELQQSMTGEKYSTIAGSVSYNTSGIYDTALNGVIAGMFIRVCTKAQPDVAKFLL